MASLIVASALLGLPSGAPAGFQTGLDWIPRVNPSAPTEWNAAISATGANIIRRQIAWSTLAPTRPNNELDQNDPSYRWSELDWVVRRANAMGKKVLLNVYIAPTWAEGPGRPNTGFGPCSSGQIAGENPPCIGSWKPDPQAFGRLAAVLATRYSGNTPDPLDPAVKLPRVSLFEPWNEPNYKMFLTPQCTKGSIGRNSVCSSGGRVVAVEMYRALLNSFYDGAKSVQPDAKIIAGAFGPYGNSSQGFELEPQAFARALMCLGGTPSAPKALTAGTCPVKAKFDILSFHPYSVLNTPRAKAWSADGATLGNTPEVRAALDLAVSKKTILPAGSKDLWATETGFFSCPPCDPAGRGLAVAAAADYTAEMLYRLWSWKVQAVFWFGMLDDPPKSGTPGTASGWPAGLYYHSTSAASLLPKPALAAFRFPVFAAKSGAKAFGWTRSPCTVPGAKLTFQALNVRSGKPTTVATATIPAGSDGVVKTPTWAIPASTGSVRVTVSGSGCASETSIAMPISSIP